MPKELKPVLIKLEEEDHRRFKAKAAERGNTMRGLVTKWVLGYIENDQQPK